MEDSTAEAIPMYVAPSWPDLLNRLVDKRSLSFDEAYAAMADMLAGETANEVTAAFLTALRCKGESPEEMAGLASAMADYAIPVPWDGDLIDTCGTGGDQKHSVNISTMAALVVAASGKKVCKHGNRASSSKSGSADVLEYLGVRIDLGPAGVRACIEQVNMGFALAPRFHRSMAHVIPVRRALGVPTAFNFLGPLVNPARANRQLVGVFEARMARTLAEVLAQLGTEHAMVAYSADGFDELSTTSPNHVIELHRSADGGAVFEEYTLDARDFGIARAVPADLEGGDPRHNGESLRAVFAGRPGPVRDVVLLNAGAALYLADAAPDIASGIALAGELIDTGRAAGSLAQLVEVSNSLG
ncbi:MAG: anthranilate phosphoribosyltransferase [Actinomycetota bacterium]|nr:anthranilate phosphoribosyltransferase [Actinomycetota bacterium]